MAELVRRPVFWVRMLHAARAGADHFVMGAPLVVRGLVLHLYVTRRLVEDSCNSSFSLLFTSFILALSDFLSSTGLLLFASGSRFPDDHHGRSSGRHGESLRLD